MLPPKAHHIASHSTLFVQAHFQQTTGKRWQTHTEPQEGPDVSYEHGQSRHLGSSGLRHGGTPAPLHCILECDRERLKHDEVKCPDVTSHGLEDVPLMTQHTRQEG